MPLFDLLHLVLLVTGRPPIEISRDEHGSGIVVRSKKLEG
jgi:hypothetical protein